MHISRHLIFALYYTAMLSQAFAWPTNTKAHDSIDMPDRYQTVQFAEGHLSLDIRNVEIGTILNEISRQTELELFSYADLNESVTTSFRCLPLGQAVRRLLANYSFVLLYPQHGRSSGQKRLWIFPHSNEIDLHTPVMTKYSEPLPADGSSWHDLGSIDPLEREEAVIDLTEMNGEHTIVQLSVALNDNSRRVREVAIEGLADIGTEEALRALEPALYDQDPGLRMDTVEALVDIDGHYSHTLLQKATFDINEAVREAAFEALEYLRGGDLP